MSEKLFVAKFLLFMIKLLTSSLIIFFRIDLDKTNKSQQKLQNVLITFTFLEKNCLRYLGERLA